MSGSSETLEELMCVILGHMIQEGTIAKISNDLYVGGNNIEELYNNWSRVLQAKLSDNGLKLKAPKTFIGNNGSIFKAF